MDNVVTIYSSLIKKYDLGNPKCLGWGSKESQVFRYKVFDYLNINKTSSILDVGSGFGDYYEYLSDKGFSGNYLGVEIVDEFYHYSCSKHGNELFKNINFLEFESALYFEFIIGSGLFWIDSPSWEHTYLKTLEKMFFMSKKGIAFNLLSPHTPIKNEKLRYVEIEYAISSISKLTSYFCIKHDYHSEMKDYTCFLFKNTNNFINQSVRRYE